MKRCKNSEEFPKNSRQKKEIVSQQVNVTPPPFSAIRPTSSCDPPPPAFNLDH